MCSITPNSSERSFKSPDGCSVLVTRVGNALWRLIVSRGYSGASDKHGGPSGLPQPTNTGDDDPRDPAVASPGTFNFEFLGCTRTFSFNRGRRQHYHRAHVAWYDAWMLDENVDVERRWNEEELRIMAKKEAELSIQGICFLNQALHLEHRGRTLDSIKGQQRGTAYKS
ncbi:hypothetical protein HHI36_022320 [Cryptolaemus montrouzieri]|uniref:C2H2-type domain-containing protein n=1 Tax=Cryptolaemus montrouzieri TaxID=559131 RepID=A0ABD2N075_9CUCU